MFKPLAWTKTLAVGFSSLLAITLVPVLMVMFIQGQASARIAESDFAGHAGVVPAGPSPLLEISQDDTLLNLAFLAYVSAGVQARQPIHAAAL